MPHNLFLPTDHKTHRCTVFTAFKPAVYIMIGCNRDMQELIKIANFNRFVFNIQIVTP